MNSFILGDCIDVMGTFSARSVDFILTDPPYLVNYHDRSGRSIANDIGSAWLEPAFAEMYRVLKSDSFCVSFYGWSKVDRFFAAWKKAGFRIVGHLVFAKEYSSKSSFVAYQHESAYLLVKGHPEFPVSPIPDVLPWTYSGNTFHPTEKSVATLTPLIQTFSATGDLVLDPFAGSGSTCLAASTLGRSFMGIELDKKYHTIAEKRLFDAKAQAEGNEEYKAAWPT